MPNAEHQPWTGDLSCDLRDGTLAVSTTAMVVIDANRVAWLTVLPDAGGFYDHAAKVVAAVNSHDALVKALTDIIEANKNFRDGMPQSWDGDPLQDACDAAKTILEAAKGGAQ